MISELKKLGDKVIIKGSNAGSSLLLEWRGEMGEEELVKVADEAGVKMYPLSSYLIGSYLIMYPTFVMGFSSLNEDAIGEAVSILGEKWR
jgi:GntR family transcriptional regulator/MocR family aminotransferase